MFASITKVFKDTPLIFLCIYLKCLTSHAEHVALLAQRGQREYFLVLF